jgi:hypothetical protein
MDQSLISRLLGRGPQGAAETPAIPPVTPTPATQDPKLASILERIQQITQAEDTAPRRVEPVAPLAEPASIPPAANNILEKITDLFVPVEPKSIREAGLNESELEGIVLKYLLARGSGTGREVAEQCRLPFIILDALMRQMKIEQLLVYRGSSEMNDFCYQLTDLGRERARRLTEHCSYYGAAPVPLTDYLAAVKKQSLTQKQPTQTDLQNAFEDLLINKRMLDRLGPAINSGRGMFLFGSAGNGKTSIAERITRSFGDSIWIPRAIGIDGEILRLYDPNFHDEIPLPESASIWNGSAIDKRWVRIRRPTIVVGGELTMDNLEVTMNDSTGISESPVQLKSNCGTLVIDDFGRQKMGIDTLLNRWIVPLEKRYDFLNMPNGKKIQVPFDQLIVFSTNLEPKALVDEAFLRRIPYKIEVIDPTEQEFRDLFKMMCPKLGFTYNEEAITYLIENQYRKNKRAFRCCQPRDLLQQVKNHCLYQQIPLELKPDFIDLAVENYFAIM